MAMCPGPGTTVEERKSEGAVDISSRARGT